MKGTHGKNDTECPRKHTAGCSHGRKAHVLSLQRRAAVQQRPSRPRLSSSLPRKQLGECHEPVASGLQRVDDQRHGGQRRLPARIPDVEENDRPGPDSFQNVRRDSLGTRGDLGKGVGLDVPRDRSPSGRSQIPGQPDELVPERRAKVDRAAVAGGANQGVGSLDLLWLPRSCPAATSRRPASGAAASSDPITKNVA
jgi:hypothetical protein